MICDIQDASLIPELETFEVYAQAAFLKAHATQGVGWLCDSEWVWPYYICSEHPTHHPISHFIELKVLHFTGAPIARSASVNSNGLKLFMDKALQMAKAKNVDVIEGAPYRYDLYSTAPEDSIHVPFGT